MSMGETDGVKLKARPFPGQITFLFANLFAIFLFFIVTESITNLRHVESPGLIGRAEIPSSTLEDLTFQIGCGEARNYGPPRWQVTRFDVEIPFTLHPRICAGETVPDSQQCEEWPITLESLSKSDEPAAKVWCPLRIELLIDLMLMCSPGVVWGIVASRPRHPTLHLG